jgi:NCS2 family nucleobase:cation symporter-2
VGASADAQGVSSGCSGFIVIAVGVELGLIGVRGFLGVADLHDPKLPTHIAGAGLTLAVMVGLGVWARAFCGCSAA